MADSIGSTESHKLHSTTSNYTKYSNGVPLETVEDHPDSEGGDSASFDSQEEHPETKEEE